MIKRYINFLLLFGFLFPFSLSATEPILNIKYSNAQQVALEFGFIKRNLTGSVELGLSGQKVRLGYGKAEGSVGAILSRRVVASYLYQMDDYTIYKKGHHYLGVEAVGMLMFLTGSLGLFYDPQDNEAKLLITIGLGM